MRSNILLFIICLAFVPFSQAQINAHLDRKMAIFLPDKDVNVNYQADLSSVKQMAAVSGLPYQIHNNFDECLDYGMILFAVSLEDSTLTGDQKNSLKSYVENGGCVVIPGLMDTTLYSFAGINAMSLNNNRHYLTFTSSLEDKELRWIDDPYERDIKLGATQYGGIFATFGYKTTDAEVLALFRSGRAGLVRTKRGSGYVYLFGFNWRDLIIRNLLDRDYTANRAYSNYFEATADVVMLLVRGIFTVAVPHAVWISPSPYDSKATFIITHDVCSHTAHIFDNDFAEEEYQRGISATYNITTHQFIDDINGDNYSSHIAQLKLLLEKNHVIGSHSYGHFPDFFSADIFPVGEKLSSAADYHPHYSKEEARTIGGTVYGELGVSQMLLEHDLNIHVTEHRSGHLAVNPKQYNILDDLGYHYSSSYTAADVLTGFPFYEHYDRAMNGETLPITEIPLAISDVFGSHADPIDEFNWMDKVEIWRTVIEKYADNNAMTNILIHPNREFKLDAEIYLLDHISKDIYVMELTKYADFWNKKNTLQFSSSVESGVLKIYADDVMLGDDRFSFVIDYPNDIHTVEVYNENGELQDFYQREYYKGTGLMYQKSFADLKSRPASLISRDDLLSQNYPNPFTSFTHIDYHVPEEAQVRIDVMNMFGSVVKQLVNEKRVAGDYQLTFDAHGLASGIYFYRIYIQTSDSYDTSTQKMIIK